MISDCCSSQPRLIEELSVSSPAPPHPHILKRDPAEGSQLRGLTTLPRKFSGTLPVQAGNFSSGMQITIDVAIFSSPDTDLSDGASLLSGLRVWDLICLGALLILSSSVVFVHKYQLTSINKYQFQFIPKYHLSM